MSKITNSTNQSFNLCLYKIKYNRIEQIPIFANNAIYRFLNIFLQMSKTKGVITNIINKMGHALVSVQLFIGILQKKRLKPRD